MQLAHPIGDCLNLADDSRFAAVVFLVQQIKCFGYVVRIHNDDHLAFIGDFKWVQPEHISSVLRFGLDWNH